MARLRLVHVSADRDRHGNVRYYFRKRGLKNKTRLPGLPGSEEFMDAYKALCAGKPLPKRSAEKTLAARADTSSLRWLVQQYLASTAFKSLDAKTRTNRARNLAKICEEPISDANSLRFGEGPFADLPSKAIKRLLERKADSPTASNDWLKSLKVLFKWATQQEYTSHNPVREIPKIKVVSDGFHTWSEEEVRQFEQKHPVGSPARLALALFLYTGQRLSDVILFGPQHIKGGWLRFTQQKNRNVKPVTLEIPVLPILADIIAATPTGHLTFLVSRWGKPFTLSGFGARFRRWCDAAGLPHCTAHGLRKAGASRAAENGATAAQLMAIFGWRDISQAEHYTRGADQKRLAGSSMHLIRGMDKA
jgi:integrase